MKNLKEKMKFRKLIENGIAAKNQDLDKTFLDYEVVFFDHDGFSKRSAEILQTTLYHFGLHMYVLPSNRKFQGNFAYVISKKPLTTEEISKIDKDNILPTTNDRLTGTKRNEIK